MTRGGFDSISMGARDTLVSISLGLGPDFGDTGGVATSVRGARDTGVSISLRLSPDFGDTGGVDNISAGGERYGGINLTRAGPHKFLL